MSKILVLECKDGDLIFVGNEFSRDPVDIGQMIATLPNRTPSDVLKVLLKNGYTEYNALKIKL